MVVATGMLWHVDIVSVLPFISLSLHASLPPVYLFSSPFCPLSIYMHTLPTNNYNYLY
jgi:hypothetical protein